MPIRARCCSACAPPPSPPAPSTCTTRSSASTVGAGRVRGVSLARAGRLDAPVVVNAAGALAGRIATLAGLAVPVEPVRQLLFRCTLPRHWPTRFPMVIDPGGVHWRHDDPVAPGDPDRITLAFTKWDEPAGERFDCDDARWEHEFYPGAGAPHAGAGRGLGRGRLGGALRDDARPQPGARRASGARRSGLRERLQRTRADDVAGHRPRRVRARPATARAAPSTSRRSRSIASNAARSCATAPRSDGCAEFLSCKVCYLIEISAAT